MHVMTRVLSQRWFFPCSGTLKQDGLLGAILLSLKNTPEAHLEINITPSVIANLSYLIFLMIRLDYLNLASSAVRLLRKCCDSHCSRCYPSRSRPEKPSAVRWTIPFLSFILAAGALTDFSLRFLACSEDDLVMVEHTISCIAGCVDVSETYESCSLD